MAKLDKIDKILLRAAGVSGIIIAVGYWFLSNSRQVPGKVYICQYAWVALTVLVIILAFYMLLTRALLKHLHTLSVHYQYNEDVKAEKVRHPKMDYYTLLFEALIVSTVIIVTIAAVGVHKTTCYVEERQGSPFSTFS